MSAPLAPSDTPPSIFSVISALARKHEAVNLGQGFPDFDPDPELTARLSFHTQHGRNQYAPPAGVPRLLRAIAQKVKRCHELDVDPGQEITISSGATQAIWTTVQAIVRPGDEVIIFEPAYDSYAPAVRSAGGTVVPVVLRGPHFLPDWTSFAERLTDRTRLVIINNPHNPTGTCWRDEDLRELARLLRPTSTLLLSDEVYEHIVFDGRPHRCALSYPGLRDRTFVTASFGKTFHVTGWKVGYVLAHPILMQHYRALHQYTVFTVNTPAQHALADYLAEPRHYLNLGQFFQAKRDRLIAALADTPLRLLPSAGSYFLLADYGAISNEKDGHFARWLIEEHGVATIPISPFYSEPVPRQRYVRFCFAKRAATLDAAAKRLAALGRTHLAPTQIPS